ncbi:MAG: glycosyltransferase family 4 protein [Candidatus Binatia bacterium]|jgi:phosphatidyl-myo-inositol dimannoside synthase
MNILMLSWNYPTTHGGIERLVGDLYERLVAEGNATWLLTGQGGKWREPGDVLACPAPGVVPFLVYATVRGLFVARRHHPQVIVCSSIVAAPVGAVLSALLGVPYVLLVHGTEVVQGRLRHRRLFEFLVRRAAMLTANSRKTAELLTTAARMNRVAVVHPGVRSERFRRSSPWRAATGGVIEAGRPVILTLGRLVRRKGVLEFVQHVLPGLVEEFPGLVYLVAGDDPTRSLIHQERPRVMIERAVAGLGLESCVRLLGAVSDDDLPSLYWRADIFVLPCLEMADDIEGFGIAALEAAAAGVPTVATRVGGIPEAVLDGTTGLLVAPGDYEGMGHAIRRLLLDAPLRLALGSAAAERARREFDWSVVLKRYIEVFESCLRVTSAVGRGDDTTAVVERRR